MAKNKTTYQWTISALDCAVSKDGLTNVVETVHWRYRGTNENNTTAETYGAQSVVDPNPEAFTPFDQLTKEIVEQWLEEIMYMEEIQSNIDNQIQEIENPTHITLQLVSDTPEPTEPTEPEEPEEPIDIEEPEEPVDTEEPEEPVDTEEE